MKSPIEVPKDSPTAKVHWATTSHDFIPFTALPSRFHNKRVAIVIVPDDFGKDVAEDVETP